MLPKELTPESHSRGLRAAQQNGTKDRVSCPPQVSSQRPGPEVHLPSSQRTSHVASPYSVFPPERTGHQVPGSLPEYWAVTHPPACSSQSWPRVDRALCGCGRNTDQPWPRVGPAHVAPSSAQQSPASYFSQSMAHHPPAALQGVSLDHRHPRARGPLSGLSPTALSSQCASH